MKTNSWKITFMTLIVATAITGCNQNNELGTSAPSNDEDVLNVVATANDFVSSDASSRVSESDYTTTFEKDDAIGVFVVRDGETLISNMKMTLGEDGTTWAGENGAKLYYYKDADYIAYSPYAEGLSATTESDIVDYFTTKLEGTTGQSTLAEYQAADLMTASVPAEEVTRGQNITFRFAHQMSMIEIKVPIRAYATTGGYEYSAPLGLSVKIGNTEDFSLCTFGKETTGGAGSEVTKGVYRCIVAPSVTALSVEGEFQDGSIPVYFPATGGEPLSVTPEAGKYKGIDVNYTYDSYTATRDLEVGDYYYADGSIYPKGLGNAPETGCVGVIFSTTTSDTDKNTHGWKNGYVVSLFDTDDINTKYSWSTVNEDIPSLNLYEKSVQSFTDAFADYDGYSATQAILAAPSYSAAAYAAVNAAVSYGKEIPSSTSGWYLPSVGQIALIINNLGAKNGTKPDALFTPQNAADGLGGSGKFDEKRGAPEAMLALQQTLQKVGGEFYYYPIADSQNYGYRWWTSSGVHANNAKSWSIDTNSYKFLLYDASKSETGSMHVRPVFAF